MNPLFAVLIGGAVLGTALTAGVLQQTRSRELILEAQAEADARRAVQQVGLAVLAAGSRGVDGSVTFSTTESSSLGSQINCSTPAGITVCTPAVSVSGTSVFAKLQGGYSVPAGLQIEVCPLRLGNVDSSPSGAVLAPLYGVVMVQGSKSLVPPPGEPVLVVALTEKAAPVGCAALYEQAVRAPETAPSGLLRLQVWRISDFDTARAGGRLLPSVATTTSLPATAVPGSVRLVESTGYYYQFRDRPLSGYPALTAPLNSSGSSSGWGWMQVGSFQGSVSGGSPSSGSDTVCVPGGTLGVLRRETGNTGATLTATEGQYVAPFCTGQHEASVKSDNPLMETELSHAGGLIPARVSWTEAKSLCARNGMRLMDEWQRRWLNALVLSDARNWVGGSVGGGAVVRGHVAGLPNQVLPGGLDDKNGMDGLSSSDASLRRTYYLPNGGVIWDLSGNVAEWIDWKLDPRAWRAYRDGTVYNPADGGEACDFYAGACSAVKTSTGWSTLSADKVLLAELMPMLPSGVVGSAAFQLGQFMRPAFSGVGYNTALAANNTPSLGVPDNFSAVLRGGSFNSGTAGGLGALDIRYGAAYIGAGAGTVPATGFRCVK